MKTVKMTVERISHDFITYTFEVPDDCNSLDDAYRYFYDNDLDMKDDMEGEHDHDRYYVDYEPDGFYVLEHKK